MSGPLEARLAGCERDLEAKRQKLAALADLVRQLEQFVAEIRGNVG